MANYADIVRIDAPAEAYEGQRVDVTVQIKNIWTSAVHVYCVAVVDSARFIDWLDDWVSPGDTRSFSGAFIMGGADATILAQSWYEGSDSYLHQDDEMTRKVRIAEVPESNFGSIEIISYARR